MVKARDGEQGNTPFPFFLGQQLTVGVRGREVEQG